MPAKFQNSLEAIQAAGDLSTFLHPDYKYYREDWRLIRDCIWGERRIKDMGTMYLPPLGSDLGTDYSTYKDRAVFVNMVGRTVSGLVGTIFRRPVKVEKVDKGLLKDVTLNSTDFNLFAKKLAWEICAVGRVGVLVDMLGATGKPYFTEYIAENILSWRTEMVNGREVLKYVLLREIQDDTPTLEGNFVSRDPFRTSSNLRARYRVLLLDNGVYKQRLYDQIDQNGNPTFVGESYTEIVPTRNGTPFDFIPMVIIGALSPTPEIQKSPILDIAFLNIAHYKTSAQLEHGRYFTATPVYYVQVSAGQEEQSDYVLGGSVVWEVPTDARPGILEYFGTGLTALANSLVEKEEHIAQLGGRIMGIRPAAVAESDNIFKLKQANEMSILLNITESLASGLTKALLWFLDWQRAPIEGVRVHLNQDFKALQIGARELRAVALLYQTGILPLPEMYRVFQEAEIIGDEITLDEFRDMLENIENFPNQPDVEAMREGYADAKDRLKDRISLRETGLDAQQKEADRANERLIEQRKLDQQRAQSIEGSQFTQTRRTNQFDSGN